MKTLLKNWWVLLTIALIGLGTSCSEDKEEEKAIEIIGEWALTSTEIITKDADGNETKEEANLPQEEIWKFGEDGKQYTIINGVTSEFNYSYTISGKKITLKYEEEELVGDIWTVGTTLHILLPYPYDDAITMDYKFIRK